ncbi:MAG: hypothetical protein WBH00_11590 [Xanthobacteraceae bacterium]
MTENPIADSFRLLFKESRDRTAQMHGIVAALRVLTQQLAIAQAYEPAAVLRAVDDAWKVISEGEPKDSEQMVIVEETLRSCFGFYLEGDSPDGSSPKVKFSVIDGGKSDDGDRS